MNVIRNIGYLKIKDDRKYSGEKSPAAPAELLHYAIIGLQRILKNIFHNV